MHLRAHALLSVKTALAAGLAWLLVQPLWGVADEYPYYAPLGAVIAVATTVAGSMREALQGLAAILLGASLVLAVRPADLPVVVEIVLVVGVGSALSAWRGFGSKASYVPVTAIFTLIIGGSDPLEYAIGYLGLAGIGTAVGVAVNLVFPPLGMRQVADSIHRLRSLLAEQLDQLAEGLLREDVLTVEEWERRRHAIRPTTEELQQVVGHATDARRANWRARRWSETADRRYQEARALQQVALLIDDITTLVIEQEHADRKSVALGPNLRPHAAHALQEMAEVLRAVEGGTAPYDDLREADDAVLKLVEEIRVERRRSEVDLFAAGTVVAGVRRAMASLVPSEHRGELPSDW
jgi:uncharacterized membrane protein YgaE (UPF0421/DUF939 family)